MARRPAALLLALSLLLIGCNSSQFPTAKVTGKVSHKGKPLNGGQITFFQHGRPYIADIGQDGSYSLMAGIGECQVTVEWRESVANDLPIGPKKGKGPKALVPEKYRLPRTSGLTFDVKSG